MGSDDDETVTYREIRRALCEHCAGGVAFVVAEGWYPNMFHDWDVTPGSRTKCQAFDVIHKINSIE